MKNHYVPLTQAHIEKTIDLLQKSLDIIVKADSSLQLKKLSPDVSLAHEYILQAYKILYFHQKHLINMANLKIW